MMLPAEFTFRASIFEGDSKIPVEVSGLFLEPYYFTLTSVTKEDTGEDITNLLTEERLTELTMNGNDEYDNFLEEVAEEIAERRMDR